MSKIATPTKVITGVNTKWSYANVWDPKSIKMCIRDRHKPAQSVPYIPLQDVILLLKSVCTPDIFDLSFPSLFCIPFFYL